MRRAGPATLLTVLAACQGGSGGTAASGGSGSARPAVAPAPDDAATGPAWTRCAAALRRAPSLPAARRVQALLESCQPCGDWTPLLAWSTPATEGGPTRATLEAALAGCEAYCDATAKQRFLGTLDDARGTASRAPWRHLGEVCGAAVSAVPDTRFASAPYFALDRIARAAAARPTLAPLLAALEVPLPPVSLTGAGYDLPTASVTRPDAGPVHVTVTAQEVRVGELPRARLTADGIVVDHGPTPYPGAVVEVRGLAAALAAHTSRDAPAGAAPGTGSQVPRVALLAPSGLPAHRLVDVLAAAAGPGEARRLELVVRVAGGPPGWLLAGSVPVALVAAPPRGVDGAVQVVLRTDPDAAIADLRARPPGVLAAGPVVLALDPQATVADLAKVVGALAFLGVDSAALTHAPRPRPSR